MSLYTCLSKNVIEMTKGSTFNDSVIISNPDGSPFNLTGCTVISQLRDYKMGSLIGTFTCTFGTPLTGLISRSLSAAVTSSLNTANSYVWGLKVTKPDTSVLPEIQGGIRLINNVVA